MGRLKDGLVLGQGGKLLDRLLSHECSGLLYYLFGVRRLKVRHFERGVVLLVLEGSLAILYLDAFHWFHFELLSSLLLGFGYIRQLEFSHCARSTFMLCCVS